MKTRNFFFLTLLSACCFFTSCNEDDNTSTGKAIGNQPVKFNTSINGSTIARATGTTWGNDAIGVYMKSASETLTTASELAGNKKYTTPGTGTFIPADVDNTIYFPENGSNVDFIAYYPYQATINNHIYPVNVTNQSTPANIDLMYSDDATGLNNASEEVNLGFSHMLTNLIMNVTHEGGASLTGLEVTIANMYTQANFSLADASFTNVAETIADITALTSANGNTAVSSAIILPTTGTSGVKITFSVPSLSKIYVWEIEDGKIFEGKYKYTFDINLKSDGTVIAVNPEGNITDWTDGTGGTINLDEEDEEEYEGDGSKATPYTVAQLAGKIGETGVWARGYIVGTSGVLDFTDNTNILIAESADETNEANCVYVALEADSDIQKSLNLVDNADLVGALIKVQGTIAAGTNGTLASITAVTDQEGGKIIGGDKIIEFSETFGSSWRKEGDTGTLTLKWDAFVALDQFDMKAPIVYSVTGDDGRTDFRCTAGYDNPHIWFAANYNTSFKIEGIEEGYKNMTLSYDLAANKTDTPYNGIMVKCNDVDVTIPSGTFSASNTFATITIAIPDGTTKIEFYGTPASNPTGVGYRVDNIKISNK